MNKLAKIGIGLAAGAIAGAVAYKVYSDSEAALRAELIDVVRAEYADAAIDVVWLFDKAVQPGIFAGGLNISGKTTEFVIDEKTYEITEIETTNGIKIEATR
jgi:hypothetical protein